jgi:RNA-directed DNA polymerase
MNWGTARRRLLDGWRIRDGSTVMFRPQEVPVTRYLYRGTKIPSPWAGVLAGTA